MLSEFRRLEVSELQLVKLKEFALLQISDLHYQKLFESIQTGILLIDSDSASIIDINPFLADFLGYSRKEIIGKKPWEIDSLKNIISCNDSFLKLLSSKNVKYEDLQIKKRDGNLEFIEFTSNVCRLNDIKVLQCIIKDISNYKRLEKTLTTKERTYRALFENNPQPMWVYDLKTFAFLKVNKAAVQHYGYEQNEFLNMTIKDILPADNNTVLSDNTIKSGDEFDGPDVRMHKMKNGEIIFVENISQEIEFGNRPAMLVLANDVTRRVLLEAKLKNKLNKLLLMDTTKNKFFSILAHDLRGTFSVLLGYSEFLHKDIEDLSLSEIKKYSTSIYLATEQSFRLFENLLDWSRLQMGMVNFQPTSFDINETARETIHANLPAAERKNIYLDSNFDSQIIVFADENMVKTILRNLLSNAIKFTNDGGTVKVITEMKDDVVEIKVTDTGVGISQNDINKLFRIETDYTTIGTAKERGTGLGLFLCKELVEKGGGKIWVESTPGIGSTFIFTLPNGARSFT